MKKVVDTILQRDAQGTIELTFDAVELSQRVVWISEISMESAISFARRIRFLVTESLSKNLSQIKEKLNTILSHYSGKPIKELEKVTKGDFFMTAQEAVDFGLVDEVVPFENLFLNKPI